MSTSDRIVTSRLTLIPLSADQLKTHRAGKELKDLGLPAVSTGGMDPVLHRAIGMKIEKLASAPAMDQPWITYWLIQIKSNGYGAGLIGFKGAPDDQGQVEIGYGMDPDYRSKGYTTEALQALISWAFQEPRCHRIVAPDTRRDNPASNRVLAKCGFSIYQENSEAISWSLDKKDYQELYG